MQELFAALPAPLKVSCGLLAAAFVIMLTRMVAGDRSRHGDK